ncbi:hypothetical protein CAEBREN_07540 [Caenorhabditis brenneri]|uniref:Uncharacterized protein n=1 Tax=Caenorhabditis brenneri TaxID=135651 RepID=G0MVS1_CAEBE|nr:hypothetical protein CAEBREN_07540 [Caenorhabditis brenneri]
MQMFDELEGNNTMDNIDVQAQMAAAAAAAAREGDVPNERRPFPFGDAGDLDDFLDDAPMPDDMPMNPPPPHHHHIPPTDNNGGAAPRSASSSTSSKTSSAAAAAAEDDETPLEPTQLGNALDSLMMHFCQLLTNVSVKAPVPPPSTLDHVKEVAEVCSKHFRDASVDVNNEFTRLGVQWELEEFLDHGLVEEANLDEAIDRQEQLLEAAREVIRTRLEAYKRDNPDAGTQFTT